MRPFATIFWFIATMRSEGVPDRLAVEKHRLTVVALARPASCLVRPSPVLTATVGLWSNLDPVRRARFAAIHDVGILAAGWMDVSVGERNLGSLNSGLACWTLGLRGRMRLHHSSPFLWVVSAVGLGVLVPPRAHFLSCAAEPLVRP